MLPCSSVARNIVSRRQRSHLRLHHYHVKTVTYTNEKSITENKRKVCTVRRNWGLGSFASLLGKEKSFIWHCWICPLNYSPSKFTQIYLLPPYSGYQRSETPKSHLPPGPESPSIVNKYRDCFPQFIGMEM